MLVVPRADVKKLQFGEEELTFVLLDGRGIAVPEKYDEAAANWF